MAQCTLHAAKTDGQLEEQRAAREADRVACDAARAELTAQVDVAEEERDRRAPRWLVAVMAASAFVLGGLTGAAWRGR